jgi:hypothetical protein
VQLGAVIGDRWSSPAAQAGDRIVVEGLQHARVPANGARRRQPGLGPLGKE